GAGGEGGGERGGGERQGSRRFAPRRAAGRNHSRPDDADNGWVRVHGPTARRSRVAGHPGRGHHRKRPDRGGSQPSQRRRRAHYSKEQSRCKAASTQSRDQQAGHNGDGEGWVKTPYVEDHDGNIYMLRNRLTRAGFSVVVATDGAQGVAMAASEQPDLILMDLTLPNMDGEEATRRIKADPATQHIPVIALTANAMAGDRGQALAAGCDDCDTKPVELPRLLGKIRALAQAGNTS